MKYSFVSILMQYKFLLTFKEERIPLLKKSSFQAGQIIFDREKILF